MQPPSGPYHFLVLVHHLQCNAGSQSSVFLQVDMMLKVTVTEILNHPRSVPGVVQRTIYFIPPYHSLACDRSTRL